MNRSRILGFRIASQVRSQPASTASRARRSILIGDVDESHRGRSTAGRVPLSDYYVPPTEALINELLRGQRGCLNLYHHGSGFKADLFFVVRDTLHLWAIEKRRRMAYGAAQVWIAPPEYVILRKLEYLREGEQEKHVRDVRFMLAITEVDRTFIEAQVERLGLREQWLVCQPPGGVA